jgi:RNase H-fold protein (predicted Holliday junction resolvase)
MIMQAPMSRTVLAIDPGRTKCGMALVRREDSDALQLLWRKVLAPVEVISAIAEAKEVAPFEMLVIGNGTTSRELVGKIRDAYPSAGILMIDETDTSIQARERYWEHHPRRGWRRLLPSSMQMPPESIDDFAALVLAERVLL